MSTDMMPDSFAEYMIARGTVDNPTGVTHEEAMKAPGHTDLMVSPEAIDVALAAPSPFIPGTSLQYAWDSTSLGYLKECPRKYYYTIVEGWRQKGSSVHLEFGGLYHSALERYDDHRAHGQDHESALHDVVTAALNESWPWPHDHNTKTRFNLIRSIVWYLDQFVEDAAKTVILANGKPAVELSFRFELSRWPSESWQSLESDQPYLLCGHLDRLVEFSGGTYVMDRKTTGSTLGGYYFDGYNPDNQMSLYSIAGRLVYNTPVRGVIIDAAQVAVGFTRFDRGFSHRTEAQLEEWMKDLGFYLDQAERFARDGYWPMNDRSCHNYGGCPFRKVCSKDPAVRQTFLESDFERRPWNPLEVR
jgi:hypothetical protein